MEVTYIVAPYIEARGGDIVISGDTLSGSGKLDAPGDTRISIINHSPYYLRISEGLTVLDLGGNITFNGARMYSNSDIQSRNRSGRVAQFSSIITDRNSADPLIEILNTIIRLQRTPCISAAA
jgi:hypothetical protein